jgi:hypothetical protein
MKTVVSVNEISEFEIKPKAELNAWRKQVAEEITTSWAIQKDWVSVNCPVCKSKDSTAGFLKLGFQYVECNHCKTLYAQKRPPENEINWWYTGSTSVRYWQETLLKLSAVSRETKIIEPRAHWILDGLSEYMPNRALQDIFYTDISFFGKALIEKISEMAIGMQIVSAGITDGKETYEKKNIRVKTIPSLNNITGLAKTDVLVAIDVLERISNISDFLQQLETVLNPGGLVFATTPVSSGFEIQSLWDRSPSVIPPDKLNLPSVKGLIDLVAASQGWKILELSTPGMFDVELVRQTMLQSPGTNWPRNLHALVDGIDQQGVVMFTEYLQSQRLCSFARIVLQRIK